MRSGVIPRRPVCPQAFLGHRTGIHYDRGTPSPGRVVLGKRAEESERAEFPEAERLEDQLAVQALGRGRWYVLAAGVLWSLSGVLTKSLPLDPLTIALYRGLFAGLALLPLVPARHVGLPPGDDPAGPGLRGDDRVLISARSSRRPRPTRSTSSTRRRFWVVPLGMFFLRERPGRRAQVGIALAMLGIAVIVGWGYDGRPDEWRGIALGLASGLGFAAVATGMRGLARPRSRSG